LPTWNTSKERVLAWLKENNISTEQAETVALAMAQREGRWYNDPWAVFQKLVLANKATG